MPALVQTCHIKVILCLDPLILSQRLYLQKYLVVKSQGTPGPAVAPQVPGEMGGSSEQASTWITALIDINSSTELQLEYLVGWNSSAALQPEDSVG